MTNLLSLPILPTDHWRPQTRGDCATVQRPCPYVGCIHHLYLDVKKNGGIVLNFPDKEPEELEHSCALDIANKGGLSSRALAGKLGVTRQGIEHIEKIALLKLFGRVGRG